MKQSEFFSSLLPLARKAGEAFRINPAVILAQAAIESGWGQSDLASEHHNYFGLTAYGRSNVWWKAQASSWAPIPSVSVPTTVPETRSWTTPA